MEPFTFYIENTCFLAILQIPNEYRKIFQGSESTDLLDTSGFRTQRSLCYLGSGVKKFWMMRFLERLNDLNANKFNSYLSIRIL